MRNPTTCSTTLDSRSGCVIVRLTTGGLEALQPYKASDGKFIVYIREHLEEDVDCF